MNNDEIRIDKWLWAVRVYKTRTIAIEECKKGRVTINNIEVKPSRIIKINDIIMVRKPPAVYTYKVTGLIQKRGSATIAQQNYEDLTTSEELLKLQIARTDINFRREAGTGRPTKKERRTLDRVKN